jgi:hypothetical protein
MDIYVILLRSFGRQSSYVTKVVYTIEPHFFLPVLSLSFAELSNIFPVEKFLQCYNRLLNLLTSVPGMAGGGIKGKKSDKITTVIMS